MRKLISLMLALAMVFSMAIAVSADTYDKDDNVVENPTATEPDTYTDIVKVTIHKTYNAVGDTANSPEETFNFTVAKGWTENEVTTYVENPGVGVTNDNSIPAVTVATNPHFAEGAAGDTTKNVQDLVLTLPTYTNVGVYYYTITETASTTAGVTSHSTPIKLVVTVVQQGADQIRVAAVHTEVSGSTKSDDITNTYSAGTLTVSKTVTGNMGDRNKEFTITIEFTAPTGMTVKEDITTSTGSAESVTVTPADWKDGKATKTIPLKHDETVTFENIPYGVTYKVTEALTDDYTEKVTHNSATQSEGNEATETIDADIPDATVAFENFKETDVDTGIITDSAPYILLIAICAVAAVVFVTKRRAVEF